ncbi:MAG: HEAT repeat domain-containing protein [Verrucomicrobiae bacterium]|nr:HEAT repeat domain-containing protein [Verrucomicrobiae bacterium]
MGHLRSDRTLLICLALGVLVVSGVAAERLRRGAAAPFGKPLGYWLEQWDKPSGQRDSRALEALVAVPQKAVPALARRVSARPGGWRERLVRLATAFPQSGLRVRDADTLRRGAAEALGAMGPLAEPAAGALVGGLGRARHAGTVEAIHGVLLRLGPPAAEALLIGLSHADPVARRRALRTLEGLVTGDPAVRNSDLPMVEAVVRRLGDDDPETVRLATGVIRVLARRAEVALPGLLANAGHPSPSIRSATAAAIGALASDAGRSVPALMGLLEDADDRVRVAAAGALGRFGADAAPAVTVLATLCGSNVESSLGLAVANCLGRIGVLAVEAVPGLAEVREGASPLLRGSRMAALGRIGGRPDVAVPALANAMRDEDAYVRRNAVWALAAFGEEAAPAVAALIEALQDPVESIRVGAVEALGAIGPAAAVAVPHLHVARRNNPSVMNRPALAAIAQISGAVASVSLPAGGEDGTPAR